jgi:TatD DNase family protein
VSLPLPALDAHAHVEVTIAPAELTALDAVVFAVTRERTEWQPALAREDELALWGLGCHPGLPKEVADFEPKSFRDLLASAPLVGEVGLDAKSEASIEAQQKTFERVLSIVAEEPRPISIHSVGACSAVLDSLERHPQRGAILHWWRGTRAETERAIEFDCYFSVNGVEVRRPKILDLLPPERVLTETDFPFTRRSDEVASRPGSVETIERKLEEAWGTDRWGVRKQIWSNVDALFRSTGCLELLPAGIRQTLLAVPAA